LTSLSRDGVRRTDTFDRHVVALPDVLAKGTDAPDLALKPVFDLLWQAAGSEGSQHYAENGTRLPTR